jgi:hypothetical protein
MERRGPEPDRVSEGDVREPDIDTAFREGTAIDRALGRAAQEALRMHKRMGNPIAVGKAGEVIWIPPEKIPVQD